MKIRMTVLALSLMPIAMAQSSTLVLEGFAQGTMYHITYVDSLHRNFRDSINVQLQLLDASLSTYQPNSIISKINRNEQVEVDEHFQICFTRSRKIWKESGGMLDATVLPLTHFYGLRKPDLGPFSQEKLDSLMDFVGYEKVKLKKGSVCKKDPRVQLDFNAFAQGYSVDVLGDYLHRQGIHNFLVELGGEVCASGVDEAGRSWIVGIEKPEVSGEQFLPVFQAVALEDKAIATSGNYRKFFENNGQAYGHQINPLTGHCALSSVLSATVIAEDAFTADAYATVFCVLGLEESKNFIQQHPELELSIIFPGADGKLETFQTEGFKSLVRALEAE